MEIKNRSEDQENKMEYVKVSLRYNQKDTVDQRDMSILAKLYRKPLHVSSKFRDVIEILKIENKANQVARDHGI